MKHCIIAAALCLLIAVLLPTALWEYRQSAGTVPASEDAAGPTPGETPAPVTVRADSALTVTLLRGGETAVMTMEEYLPGVVAGEMPAAFAPDALRAQAVAARTYALYRKRTGSAAHPEADVCGDPGCCQAWLDEDALRGRWGEDDERYAEIIASAAADTDGMILCWENEPILACFHASSAGMTESSAALWGTALPYLVSVESPETAQDVPGFVTSVEVSPEELASAVRELAPRADLTGAPERWIGESIPDRGGRVSVIRIGGAALTGAALRDRFGLRSGCFTLSWTGHSFLFTVTGSGHGAGMSQYGANVMARQGSTWQEILAHYYPGTQLVRLR